MPVRVSRHTVMSQNCDTKVTQYSINPNIDQQTLTSECTVDTYFIQFKFYCGGFPESFYFIKSQTLCCLMAPYCSNRVYCPDIDYENLRTQ